MLAALRQAKKGLKEGEVPIGAVVVYENKVVAKGYNRRLTARAGSFIRGGYPKGANCTLP